MTVRVRIRFTKTGKIRWTSHRDVARMWERALRRAELPVSYTEGFSPRPKLSFGLALPTGHASLAEYVDVSLDDDRLGPGYSLEQLPDVLSRAFPVGVEVVGAVELEPRSDSLQQEVVSSTWEIDVVGEDVHDLSRSLERALAAPELPIERERKGRRTVEDVRPAILALELVGPVPDGGRLVAELAAQPRALRPVDLLRALDPVLEPGLITRTHQWTMRDGARGEPLPTDATATHPALERVS